MLFAVAEGYLDNEEVESAMRSAAKALVLFQEAADQDGIADTVRTMVHGMRFQEKRTEAIEVVNQYLAVFQGRNDEKGIAKMLLSLAELNSDKRGQNKRGEAFQCATEALDLFREQGNKRLQTWALIEIANMHTKNYGDIKVLAEKSMEAAKEAHELCVETGDRRLELVALHAIAMSHALSEDFTQALRVANDALDIIQELGLRKVEAFELQAMAGWYTMAGKFPKALGYAEEALEIYTETNANPHRQNSATRALFDVRIQMAQFALDSDAEERALSAALKLARNAGERFEEMDFRSGVASSWAMQAHVHRILGDKEEALRCAEQSMSEYRDLNDRCSQASLLRIIANLYLDREDFAKGLMAAQSSLQIYREIGAPQDIAQALLVIVKLLQAKGELKMAAQRATEGRSIMEKAADSEGEAQLTVALAEVFMAAEDYRSALRTAGEAREIYEELEDDASLANTLLIVANAHLSLATKGSRAAAPGSRGWKEGVHRALKTARESSSLAKECKNLRLRASSLITIAEVHTANQNWEECVSAANEAVMVCREANEPKDEAVSLLLSAHAYYEMDMKKDAEPAAQEALELCQYIGDAERVLEAQNLLNQMAPAKPTFVPEAQTQQLQLQQGAIPFVAKGAQQPQQAQVESKQQIQRVAGDKLTTFDPEAVKEKVREVTLTLIGEENEDEFEFDSPLMSLGLTSGTAVVLRDVLLEEIPGIKLAPTLIFDYPSASAISELIVSMTS